MAAPATGGAPSAAGSLGLASVSSSAKLVQPPTRKEDSEAMRASTMKRFRKGSGMTDDKAGAGRESILEFLLPIRSSNHWHWKLRQ